MIQLAFALCAAIIAVLAVPASAQAVELTDLERQEVKLINQYRADHGLSRLAIEVTLTKTGDWMARDMPRYGYFGHDDHLGRDPFQRLAHYRYPSNTWRGENLAAGYPDAQNTFDQWKNSAPHRANMLNSHYKAIGISLVHDPDSRYGYYWVTEFGSKTLRRMPSAALWNKYTRAQRTKFRKTARSCMRMKRRGRTYQRRHCRRNIRTARRLALV
jgi:uncharacterized protein YkwD